MIHGYSPKLFLNSLRLFWDQSSQKNLMTTSWFVPFNFSPWISCFFLMGYSKLKVNGDKISLCKIMTCVDCNQYLTILKIRLRVSICAYLVSDQNSPNMICPYVWILCTFCNKILPFGHAIPQLILSDFAWYGVRSAQFQDFTARRNLDKATCCLLTVEVAGSTQLSLNSSARYDSETLPSVYQLHNTFFVITKLIL